MGTRADFYVGRGEGAEWLGSIGWDGYPDGIPEEILRIDNENEFRKLVCDFMEERGDGTPSVRGWPWPWEDSKTTDYAYAFDRDKVHACCFGAGWFDPLRGEEKDAAGLVVFPNMKGVQNVTFGPESGLIIMAKDEPEYKKF